MDDTARLAAVPQQRPERVVGAERPVRVVRTRARRRPSGEPPPLPRHLRRTGKSWLVLLALLPVLWVLLASPAPRVSLDVFDSTIARWLSEHRSAGLTDFARGLNSLGSTIGFRALLWSTLLVCVVFRRFRHLLVFMGSVIVVISVSTAVELWLVRPRPLGVTAAGPWSGFAHPSRAAAATCVGLLTVLYTTVPQGRWRQVGKWLAAAVITVLVAVRAYLGIDGVTDLAAGIVLGVTVPLIAFRGLCPNEVFPVTYRRGRAAHLDVSGERGVAIRRALEEQLGVVVLDVQPFRLEGSAGSTPLRVHVQGDRQRETYLFAKLYAATHLRSDRWYKLGRTLMYGQLEGEARFMTVRQLVQYEDYALRLVRAAGIPCPEPYGIVEITPEREYLLVTEFAEGAVEIGEAPVGDTVIDQGLEIVRKLWEAGLAHRDIKPSNLIVRDDRLMLIDPAFSEVRPTPWRQAVDLANMMLVLALFTDAERVYERAIRYFTFEEITEAFAATRGITMPSQLRRMMRVRGRDLHKEFCALLPPFTPIKVQRWSVRRVALMVGMVAGGLTVGWLGLQTMIQLERLT